MHLRQEYDFDLHRKDIERVLRFPTVICTSRYGKRFRSYAILNSARLLKFRADQI
jgi:hypothetical protein